MYNYLFNILSIQIGIEYLIQIINDNSPITNTIKSMPIKHVLHKRIKKTINIKTKAKIKLISKISNK